MVQFLMLKISSLALAFACLALASCGAGGSTSPAKKKNDPAKDPPKDVKGCPTTPPTDYHRVIVNFTRPLPAKIALKLDGDSGPRVSECAALDQRGPIATLARNGNQLVIGVDHNNAFGSLPAEARFEILDLQGCGATMSTFYKQTASLPILYKKELPNGAQCPSRLVGEAQITPIGMVE